MALFGTWTTVDLNQMLIKRQLRNNISILYLIKGFQNGMEQESLNILKGYSASCNTIYFEKGIDKPTYDETNEMMGYISNVNNLDYNSVSNHVGLIFKGLDLSDKKLLTESIVQVFNECAYNQVTQSMIKNGYIRCLVTLSRRLSKVTYNLQEDNRILYVGKPDKFDILTFTVLGLCGVDVVICDFTNTVTSDCLCSNRFVLIDGTYKNVDLSFLKFVNSGIKDVGFHVVNVNEWAKLKENNSLNQSLNLVNTGIDTRLNNDKWNVFRLVYQGVSDRQGYSATLEQFMNNTVAMGRPNILIEGSLPKADYNETQVYTEKYRNKTFVDIFSDYSVFKNSGIPVQIDSVYNNLMSTKVFRNESQKNSYDTVLKIWLIRYLNMFYQDSELRQIPLVIIFGNLLDKDQDFIKLLGCLPLDILWFTPNYKVAYHADSQDSSYKCILVGDSDTQIVKYPKNVGMAQSNTVAYQAERDLDKLLYSDGTMFRVKQFKEINPIVLRTTYEEMFILWKEQAKFRPSFTTVGNLVTVPTIFMKIDGVNSDYDNDVQRLLGPNTIYFTNYPINLDLSYIDPSSGKNFREFTRQLVFKDTIDFERLRQSPYYKYGVYSEETQNLIFQKVQKLLAINWCAKQEKNLPYIILDVAFRLPPNVMQMIHNYDFTGNIPKLIIYNGGTNSCTLEDCIFIMLLKLIGFDIVVWAPTGYRVIEQYISPDNFNSLTIGQYDFNRANLAIGVPRPLDNRGQKKQGFFSSLFG